MAITGTQGEFLSFQVSGAGAIRSVAYGSGVVSGEDLHRYQNAIDAKVPVDATYGNVVFRWSDEIAVFEARGTGLHETGAYAALESTVAGLTYDVVHSGIASYSGAVEASGICPLYAVGITPALASGALNDAWSSGVCGNPIDGFTETGYYQTSETRLSTPTQIVQTYGAYGSHYDIWVATAVVEYTGGFGNKIASVVCTGIHTGRQVVHGEQFVPKPIVSTASSWIGTHGDSVSLVGYGFHGLTGISIGSQPCSFLYSGAQLASFTVPSGQLDDYINFYGQYGVEGTSYQKFVSSSVTAGPAANLNMSFNGGQLYYANKTVTNDPLCVFGKNFSGLTSLSVNTPSNNSIDILSASTYANTFIRVPITGLTEEGLYDLSASNSINSITASGIFYIRDAPTSSYSAVPVFSKNISYMNEHTSEADLTQNLEGIDFDFVLAHSFPYVGDGLGAEEIGVNFESDHITSGNVYYRLLKATSLQNVINKYTIIGKGVTENIATDNASSLWGSGRYTVDEFDYAWNEHSPYLNSLVCNIISSGSSSSVENPTFSKTGLMTGNFSSAPWDDPKIINLRDLALSDFYSYESNLTCSLAGSGISSGIVGTAMGSGVTINTTGLSSGQNDADLQSIIDNQYPGYSITSKIVTTSGLDEDKLMISGVSFPYPSTELSNTSSSTWWYLLNSGVSEWYPDGYLGGDSLTSGFAMVTGLPIATGFLVTTGKDSASAVQNLEAEVTNNYLNCTTGNYTLTLSGHLINITRTGYFYGHC